jgi:gamma-glutamylcyclotransferase (GGCT)/AIG2-like uncharacterized protein YtfP
VLKTSDKQRVALYGTLRYGEEGFIALGLDKHLEYISDCNIPGRIYDLGEYPGLLPEDGQVLGELYETLHAEALNILDEFEDYNEQSKENSLYIRTYINLIHPKTEAWVYMYNIEYDGNKIDLRNVIKSGDWKDYVSRKKVDWA